MTKKGSKETDTNASVEEEPTNVGSLTPAQQAEHLAGLQFTMFEVEKILGRQLDDELMSSYERGALLEEAKVREAVKRLAVRGSSPAQKQYNDLTVKTKVKNASYINTRRAKKKTKA